MRIEITKIYGINKIISFYSIMCYLRDFIQFFSEIKKILLLLFTVYI
jgi:hypothetical protein